MTLIKLTATDESIDVKRGGIITYTTDQVVDRPGIILSNNPDGEYGLIVINQVHDGGVVKVQMRPAGPSPVKKYSIGDVVAQLAVF